MTTHFAAKFKGNKDTTSLCKKYAMRWTWAKTTENQAEVDCKRCAKMLGIEPVAKVESGSASGTCQCCFGAFKLPRGRMSHHGYKRPGYGYDVGYCMGERELPYEKSCEVTKALLSNVEAYLADKRDYLSRLVAGEIKALTTQVTDYSVKVRDYEMRPKKSVVVNMGDGEVHNYEGRIGSSLSSFERVHARYVYNTKRDIQAAEEQVKFLSQKIADWKLVD